MPKTFTSNVFSSSYKDDFVNSDNYHRILFNSGRALQARELTQLQTIIQEEIGRFGRNIFKEGGAVNPGGPTIHNDYEFVKLNTSGDDHGLPADPTTLVGTTFIGDVSLVEAKVLEVVPAENGDPATLFVQYTNTQNATAGENAIRFTPDETIDNTTKELKVAATVGTDLPVGQGCKISSAEGDFFTRGHFVFSTGQSIILSKYSRYPTKVVGFKVTEDIITVSDTEDLYDNQGATPNLASPGADRYRIQLTLTTKDQIASDENFVYYCDVLEGNIVDQVKGTDDYNAPNELLATRTKEESGDYIVNPFTVDFTDSASDITATVSDGIAYVNGYRGATEKPTPLVIPKPRTTATVENQFTGVAYGQYFICSGLKGLLDTRTYATQNLSTSATDPSGSVIGTARVRYVEEDGSNFRVYLFDIKMNSGQSLRNVKTVGTNATNRGVISLEGSPGKAVLKDARSTNLVFGVPNPRPKSLTDISYEVQRILTGTASGTQLQFTLTTDGEAFSNEAQWIVCDADGDVITPTITLTDGNETATITGLANEAHTVYAKVSKGTPTVRLKNLTDATVTTTVTTGSDGVKYVDLGVTDIYSVQSVKLGSSSGADISHLFNLDNGQRAGFYGLGRMVLETGATAPSGNVYVAFKHFTHGSGDFFSVTSYNGQVDYEDIPNFSTGLSTQVNLRDVVDFRNSVNASNAFIASSATELPTNGDVVQADVEYYLPRSDKIVVTTQGEIKNIQGEAGFNSQIPATPENTLALFNVEHNAYGLNDSDVVVVPFKAKRFTMGDISKLEDRIDKVEEATALSLLEVDTANLMVLDEDGNPRTKSGFFVDNFANRAFSDADNIEYRAAVDPSRGLLSVPTLEDDVILAYDSSKSTNTIMKGDTVYLKYSESPTITQTLVSGTENVNPFAVITGEGNITMSPATDNWFQTKYTPANVINKTAVENVEVNLGNISTGFQNMTAGQRRNFLWGGGNTFVPINGFGSTQSNIGSGWRGTPAWNWRGVTQESSRIVNVGNANGGNRNEDFNVIGSFSQRIVTGTKTIRKVVGDRTVSLTFLPFIRSRKVFFRAEGLRSNTKFFPFFDGKDVSAFCRTEPFERYGALATDAQYSNRHRKSTSHPQGTSELLSDDKGKIEGSFFIPSNTTTRFRAGTREFKLLDISKNDDNTALSSASFNYTAQGTLDTRQKTITSTRVTQVRTRRWTQTEKVKVKDPLAQSFFVTNPNGIFVTKVQTYFSTKDSSIPIQLQIRPMVNGAPSSTEIHAQSIVFNDPSQVHLPSAQTQSAVEASPTTFQFEEPIFLNPETEYAIVLLAESVEYNAYVAETYAFELGSTEKRISRQPSMGSLFKSQNGTTWEPDQTKDLAFKIFTANFVSSGTAVFENRDLEKDILDNNPIYMSADVGADSDAVFVLAPNHGFSINDKVNIEGLDSATTYNGVKGASILGERTITAIDGFGIKFNADSSATSSGRFGGENILIDKQVRFDICSPNFTTMVPDDTTLVYNSKFMTGKSIAGGETDYLKDPSYSSEIVIGDENYFSAPRLVANPSNEVIELGANERSVTIKVDMATSRPAVSPVIDTQGASLSTESNQIDNQQSAVVTSGFNTPLTYSAETNAFGGSSLAKHISSVASLEEPATGMKVILAALRPSGSSLELYFRTANDGDDILGTDWTLVSPEATVAPDNVNFREYRYLIGGDTGTLDEFTEYQFKLVFKGTNSSAVPFIRDFRAIAMAT